MSVEPEPHRMAGQRSATSLLLTFASIVPVTLGAVLLWGLLDVPFDAYSLLLVIVSALAAIVAPYAVGWTRGIVGLLVLTAGLRWLDDQLSGQAPVWRVVAGMLFAAVVVGLTLLSLRVGPVRRPADSRRWQEKRDDTWPYPYA